MTYEDRLAEILGHWQEEREQGRYVELEDLCAEHPEVADELRLRIAALGVIEQAYAEKQILTGRTPKRLGEFEIARELGRGGMGVVYEAVQTTMDRTVALKVLYPTITSSVRAVKRFQREAKAAGRVQHTNIVPVYSLGNESGTWYYAMELVKGTALSTLLRRLRELGDIPGDEHHTLLGTGHDESPPEQVPGAFAPSTASLSSSHGTGAYYRDVARLFADVADALQAAHDEGVIHRDIKPSNLILDEKGVLKIVDFGIARIGDEAGGMTVTGELLGTPIYMSPEQAQARAVPIDHRTDVYSLGASLYELLTLRTPFTGSNVADVYKQVLTTAPIAPRRHALTIPRDLETIVMKAMEKERGQRYASAGAMANDLRAFAAGYGIDARRVGPVVRFGRLVKRNKVRSALTAACVAAIVTAAVLGWRGAREEARRTELEYDQLLAEIDRQSMDVGRRIAVRDRSIALPMETASPLVDAIEAAITFDADRPEAWLRRALLLDRSAEERLADVDAAEARGASPRTTDLARSLIHRGNGEPEEAAAAEARAHQYEMASPIDAYLLAALQVARDEWSAARTSLDELLATAPSGSIERRGALRLRARVRKRLGDRFGAIEDLTKLEEQGGASTYERIELAWLWHVLGREAVAEAAFARQLSDTVPRDGSAPWAPLINATEQAGATAWRERATRRAVEVHPEFAYLQVQRSRALAAAGRDIEALAAAERAVSLKPEYAEALFQRSSVRSRCRDYWGALQDLRAAARTRPGQRATDNEAWLLLHLGRTRAARSLFEQLTEIAPRSTQAWKSKARGLARMGDHEGALQAIERALELYPSEFWCHASRASIVMALGRKEEATTTLRMLLAREGLDASQLARVAADLATLGHYEDVKAAVERGLALDPDFTQLYFVRAWVYMKQDREDESIATAEHALALDPGQVNAQKLMRFFAERKGGVEAELEVVEGWIEQRPDDARLRSDQVDILDRQLGRLEEALPAYEAVCTLEPWNADALSAWMSLLLRLGRMDEALSVGRSVLEQAPDDPFLMTAVAGLFISGARDLTEALGLLDRALVVDPGNVRAYAFRSTARGQAGDMEGAEADVRRALELGPEDFQSWVARSRLMRRLGRDDEALDAARKAYELEPNFEITACEYTNLLGAVGDTAKALEIAQEIHARLPAARFARMALAGAWGNVQRFDKALPLYKEVYEDDRANYVNAVNYALTLGRLGEAARAIELLEEAAAGTGSAAAEIQSALAVVLCWSQRYDAAIEAVEAAEAVSKPAYATYAEMGDSMEAAPPEVGLRFFERMARNFPERVLSKIYLAAALARVGRQEDAFRAIDEARAIVDRTDPVQLSVVHEYLVRLGRYLDASALFPDLERAVRSTLPTANPETHALIRYRFLLALDAEARSALQRGDLVRAKEHWEEAIQGLEVLAKERQRPTLAKGQLAVTRSNYANLPGLAPDVQIEQLSMAIDGFSELEAAGYAHAQWPEMAPKFFNALFIALMRSGRYDEVKSRLPQLRAHLESHKGDLPVLVQWFPMIEHLERTIGLMTGGMKPQTPIDEFTIANLLEAQGRYDDALVRYRTLLLVPEAGGLLGGQALFEAAATAALRAKEGGAADVAALHAESAEWLRRYFVLQEETIEKDPSGEGRRQLREQLDALRENVRTQLPVFDGMRELPAFQAAVAGTAASETAK